jgi:hypothetical protein
MEPTSRRQDIALSTLRTAAAVLLGGWCSAAVIGLVSWALLDRLAAFPLAYFALPLLAVFTVAYADAAEGRRLRDALAVACTGFALGSLPVLAVLPGPPAEWLGSLLGLCAAGTMMAGLAAAARAHLRDRDAVAV